MEMSPKIYPTEEKSDLSYHQKEWKLQKIIPMDLTWNRFVWIKVIPGLNPNELSRFATVAIAKEVMLVIRDIQTVKNIMTIYSDSFWYKLSEGATLVRYSLIWHSMWMGAKFLRIVQIYDPYIFRSIVFCELWLDFYSSIKFLPFRLLLMHFWCL